MKMLLIKRLLILCLLTSFISCNNNKTSLQTYFVDHESQPNFASFDLPPNVINIEGIKMTSEQREAYESVSKLNLLVYKLTASDIEIYQNEVKEVTQILQQEKYKELIRGGNQTEGKFVVKFLGNINNIDELIVFGSVNTKGFLIARVLGDNMNAKKLMALQNVVKEADIDISAFKDITNFFTEDPI